MVVSPVMKISMNVKKAKPELILLFGTIKFCCFFSCSSEVCVGLCICDLFPDLINHQPCFSNLLFNLAGIIPRQHGAQDNWIGSRLGLYAERYHKAEADSGRISRAIQFGRIYDALYVIFLSLFNLVWWTFI